MSLQEQIRANRIRTAFVLLEFVLLIAVFGAAVYYAFNPAIGIVIGVVGLAYGLFSRADDTRRRTPRARLRASVERT